MSVICPHVCPCSLLPVPSGFSQALLESFQSFTGIKSSKVKEELWSRKKFSWEGKRETQALTTQAESKAKAGSLWADRHFSVCLQSQNLPCCSFFFKMLCINNEKYVLFSSLAFSHVPAFFTFSIAKSYFAETADCTDLCACACARTCIHTCNHNHQFLDSSLFIASAPSPSFIYLCLNLKCPCQLLLMERSLHYFSVIKKAIKLTWKAPSSSQIFHCRHNPAHYVLYRKILPPNSKYPKQPPHKHLVCFSEKEWKNLLHTCCLHHSQPPKTPVLRGCPKMQAGWRTEHFWRVHFPWLRWLYCIRVTGEPAGCC